MKKLYVLAALLTASTAAHAGNSISEGHHIHIAVPSNCSSLSCLQISASGLSGFSFGSRWNRDDDKYDGDKPGYKYDDD